MHILFGFRRRWSSEQIQCAFIQVKIDALFASYPFIVTY